LLKQVLTIQPLCHGSADYFGHRPQDSNNVIDQLQHLEILDREEFIRRAYIPTNRQAIEHVVEDYENITTLDNHQQVIKDHLNDFLESHAQPLVCCG
jgi:hypothetical protein